MTVKKPNGWQKKPFTIKRSPKYRNRRALDQVACVRCFTPVTDPELVKLHVCAKHRSYAVVG